MPRRRSWRGPSTWTAATRRRCWRRAYDHHGAAFVEIYQNCNVFNDKAFLQLTGRQERDANRIYLEAGKPLVFGADLEHGIVIGA